MAESREPSPPSDPYAGLARSRRPAARPRYEGLEPIQLTAALGLGLVLVAIGLYLWRRPHASPEVTSADALASASLTAAGDAGAAASNADAAAPSPVVLSDARVLACHDRGPKKTPADQCDRVAPIAQALANAVEQAAACVPQATTPETIEYVVDVSFSRRKVSVQLPRMGRSVRDHKVVGACATAVRSAMTGVSLDGIDHEHARYKISVTATYRGSMHGG